MRRKPNRSAIYGQAYVTHHRTPSWTTPRNWQKSSRLQLFRKTANGIQMTAYNGIIQIEVNHLANLMEVNRVKQEAEELSQTYLAFMGSSGHSVKIWVRFTRPDKSLPKNREEAEIFQAHAYRKAVSLYQPILSYSIELKKSGIRAILPANIRPGTLLQSRLHHYVYAPANGNALGNDLPRSRTGRKHRHSSD